MAPLCILISVWPVDATITRFNSAGINPMFATFHAVGDSMLVYAVDMDDDAPCVRAYLVDAVSKKLSEVSKVSSLGKAPCHLTVAASDGKS